ncbi:MAG: ATP-binding protein [Chthoniobacteraceae bacterium]
MRKRILIGLLPLFVLLLAIGIYAVSLFAKLGGAIDVILRENYASIVAAQNMKEAAERMDSALFFTLAGEEQRAQKMYQENLPVFETNLHTENGNITILGEGELAAKLSNLHAQYVARAEKYFAIPDLNARRQIYFAEMLPMFTEIKDTANSVLKLNQDNMVKADRDARDLSVQSTRYMIMAILCGGAIAIYFALRLQHSVLRPIQSLTNSAKELGEGNLDQVVPVQSQDELGQLADTFNKMATKLRAYRQVTSDEILQARQMTEITFSAFPDPIIALDANGVINFKNPSAETLLLRLKLDDHLPEQINEQVKIVLGGGADYIPASFAHAICVRPDDKETFFLPRIIGIRGDKGTIFGAAVILQNVTRLRLLDEVKTNLVSTVSHELKTPLTSVRMALHLLLEEAIGGLNPKQTELLVAARDDSERLLTMLNDLLDLARLESGESKVQIESKSPRQLVRDAVSDSKDFAETLGVKIAMEVDEELPNVGVEERQITHVFSNLITNAAKHSPLGEQVLVQARKHEGGVCFSVVDKGPGIPLQYQSRVFDKFFRVPGVERSGAGLGLSIAREIIHAHHGSLGVKSKQGEGSEFFFILPEYQKETGDVIAS